MEIKKTYQDFIVREVIDLKINDSGSYGYFILKKAGLNTIEVIDLLSKYLWINNKSIGYAGLKDKNAETYQYISIHKPDFNKINNLKLDDISLEFLGHGDKPISIGMLEGNEFTIIVRNLDKEFKKISFVENYFDEQRFSSKNVEIGRNIIKRNYKEALQLLNMIGNNINDLKKINKKELKFYINSYQSYLWNCAVAEILKKNQNFFEVDYSLGKFVFLKKKIKNFKVPLLNFDSEFDKNIKLIYEGIIKKEGITKNSFLIREIPELINETDHREVIINLNIKSKFMEDELNKRKFKQILEFKLPKGSYATIIVKKMFAF